MPNAEMQIGWISWFAMALVIVATTCVVMHVKRRCYDRRVRLPLLFKVDRNITAGSNVLGFTWLVAWAHLLSSDAARRLELLVLVDLTIGMLAQRWLLRTTHMYDTATYDGPGPLCARHRHRRIKLNYVITSMSAGWCAALSAAARPYTIHQHPCSYWFLVGALPALHAAVRTVLMDQVTAFGAPLAQSHSDELEITNEFTIEDTEEEHGGARTEEEEEDDIL